MDSDDPIARFLATLDRARRAESFDATVVALATASASGRPSVRMVLLKGADERGFVFFTNFESAKARDLSVNPQAALCFYWPSLGEQIRVEGQVERVSDAESDAYFATRPPGSQIAAWASRQSGALEAREDLLARVEELRVRFAGGEVPRPPFWGGFRLLPDRIEFWRHADDRLHHRDLYTQDGGRWRRQLLYP
jgi:pyridoxamine 5'-phosphate oxidase